ncbi:MAG TPA: permease prefix domain 1-containing protein, partial [Proteiniclasticum sp.]|nr:permease prefix domain 1-containing protein [Proteiniclasticum sp.]
METIKTYLENMFMHLPKNREALHAKEELLNMMEDKYLELKNEGRTENEAVGIVISEFGNLNEIAEELGLSQMMKDASDKPNKKVLNTDTVRDFMENRTKASYKVAIGVLLAIWSPILLILLSATENSDFMGIHNGGIALGLIVLFAMVALAVGLFIMSSVEFGRYDMDTNEDFVLDYQADSFLRSEEDRNRMAIATRITIGVVLCIVSAIPLIILAVLEVPGELVILGVGLLLLMVGAAVFLFITAGMKKSSVDILLKKGEYTVEARSRNRKSETIGTVYWP